MSRKTKIKAAKRNKNPLYLSFPPIPQGKRSEAFLKYCKERGLEYLVSNLKDL